MSNKDDRAPGSWKYILLLTIFSLVIIIPYGWLIFKAFTNQNGIPTLKNWSFLYEAIPYSRAVVLPVIWPSFRNSLLFASGFAILTICVTTPAAYALSRTKFKGRVFFTKMMIILDAFPTVALLIGFIFVLNMLGLINNYFGVILIKVGMYLPGAIWLMKGFFDYVPWDTEWSAIVDGASRFKTFIEIIVPAIKPGLAVILVSSFLSGWGEYVLIDLFIYGGSTTMSTFIGTMLSSEGSTNVPQGVMAAACVFYIIPVIILFTVSQKLLLQVSQGGSKQL